MDSPRLKTVFTEALVRPTGPERAAYLTEACRGDAELQGQAEALLRDHERIGRFLGTAPGSTGSSVEAAEPGDDQPDELAQAEAPSTCAALVGPGAEVAGAVIGPYKLLQPIGEGGMGTVYMAEQTHPVRRTVALKLIKAGMDSRQVLARFGAERQALALMDHPNIAKVFDAGTTDTGRPYFVMELVKGIPITRFCDQRRLTTRERLELAIPVCRAVQHAHQKGIIHRDLKPSNVLIALYDGKPVPKVIDFGVAKATGPRLTDQTLYTEFGAVVGTLEYMSPEQAELNQLDIDTRSDIYSLGVLLYELLTGSTPLERKQLKEVLFLEILRVIREEESPRPSMRLSTTEELPSIAACRSIEPRKLSGLIRGELDWVVMKALEKDRNRRYETANGLAADLRRYLDDEPVQACPPSMTYRMRKFARRNRGALVTGTLVALALLAAVGGIAGSIGWSVRDRQTRQAALEREVVGALREVETRFRDDDQPEAMSALRRAEGLLGGAGGSESIQRQVQFWRTDLDQAARLEEILFDTPEEEQASQARAVDEAYTRAFAVLRIDIDRMSVEQAAGLIRPRRILSLLLLALDNWSDRRHDLGFSDPSKRDQSWWQRPMDLARAVDTDPYRNRIRLAVARGDQAELDRLASDPDAGKLPFSSLRLLSREVFWGNVPRGRERAVALLKEAQVRDPGNFWLNYVLANYLGRMNRAAEQLGYSRVIVALRPKSPMTHFRLSSSFIELKRFDEAIEACREVVRLQPNFSDAHHFLGDAMQGKGRLVDAIMEYREAIRLQPEESKLHAHLGRALRETGQPGAAIKEYREVIRLDPDDAISHDSLGLALLDKGQIDQAIVEHREAIRLKPDEALFHSNLGNVLERTGEVDEAIAECREAIRIQPDLDAAHFNLGVALRKKGRLDDAIAEYRVAIRLKPDFGGAHNNLGDALRTKGELDEAIAVCREAVHLKPDDAGAHGNLGLALSSKGRIDEAIAELREVIRLKPDLAFGHNALGGVLSKKGRLDEAIAEHREAVRLKPDDAGAHCSIGAMLCDGKHDYEGAIKAFREAIRLDPTLAMAHYNLGNALISMKEHEAAIAEYRQAISLQPTFAPAHSNLGSALYGQSKLDEAIEEFREAVRLKPEDFTHRIKLGNVLGAQGKLDEAIAELKWLIEHDPKNPAGWRARAYGYQQAGRLTEARADLERALTLAPDDPTLHNDLAWLLANNPKAGDRDPKRAVRLAARAVALAPGLGGSWNTFGVARYRAGDWKAAIEALTRSMDLSNGGDSGDWFFLAMAHWQLGDKTQARSWYDKAVPWMDKNQPKNEELIRFRAEAAALLGVNEKKD